MKVEKVRSISSIFTTSVRIIYLCESIVWKDFLAAMADKSLLIKEEKIRMAFDHFRQSGGKGVKVSDLVDLIGGKEGAKEILPLDQLCNKMEITYDEFRTMMTDSFTDSESGDL